MSNKLSGNTRLTKLIKATKMQKSCYNENS